MVSVEVEHVHCSDISLFLAFVEASLLVHCEPRHSGPTA